MSAIVAYGVATTLFQWRIVSLVEERARRRNRQGLALVNLVLMPAGQAMLLALFFEVGGGYWIASPLPSAPAAGLPRIVPLWISAISGFLFGLLLTVLPPVGKYLREPEISIFFAALSTAAAYKAGGLVQGWQEIWAFGRDHPLMAVGLLALAKGISLICRYVAVLLSQREHGGRGGRKTMPGSFLAMILGISSTLMLIPVFIFLGFSPVSPH
ncbi:MAG: hypothetical protein ACE5IQ_11800 [Candidatus Methylomirabilales bacterium]